MVYSKTAQGQAALKTRLVPMTPRQRAAFILFDGKRDVADVLKATSGLGVTPDDVFHLVSLQLIAPHAGGVQAPAPSLPANEPLARTQTAALSVTADGQPTQTAQARYLKAYPIATRLTSALGLRGFRLNLAVESAASLDKLKELAPKIKEAVGVQKFLELENALYY